MAITVEANLKIPSITVKSATEPVRRIENGGVRFIKLIDVEALPKTGELLPLSTRLGPPFEGTVTRVEWSEGKDLFIVSCSYAGRSMSVADYEFLTTDPDWTANQLP